MLGPINLQQNDIKFGMLWTFFTPNVPIFEGFYIIRESLIDLEVKLSSSSKEWDDVCFIPSLNGFARRNVSNSIRHCFVIIVFSTGCRNAAISLPRTVCRLSQPWPRLVPVQRHRLIPQVHDTLIVSAGDGPKLAILLQHYHLRSPNHGLIKVVSHVTRVQRGQVN